MYTTTAPTLQRLNDLYSAYCIAVNLRTYRIDDPADERAQEASQKALQTYKQELAKVKMLASEGMWRFMLVQVSTPEFPLEKYPVGHYEQLLVR